MSSYVEAMFSVKETPWHKLGVVLDEPPLVQDAILSAGLDWPVKMVDIMYNYRPEGFEYKVTSEIDTHKAICRLSENGRLVERVFGVVTNRYVPLQNIEAFQFFQPVVDEGLVTLESAGSLKNGEVIWILAKLESDIIVGKTVKGDEDVVKQYLLLHTAHNGRRAVKISFTPIRVVCWNTLSLTEHDTGIIIPHRKSVRERVKESSYDFSETLRTYKEIGEIYREMNTKTPDDEYVKVFLHDMFPIPDGADKNKINLIGRKRETVNTNYNQEIQSVWGLYNALTGYVDYDTVTKHGAEGRLNNIWFGSGAKLKTAAFKYLSESVRMW